MPADPNRAKDLFLAAAELPAADRPAFLAGACAGDPELRAAVERLLAAHDAPDSRIDFPGDPWATSAEAPKPPTGDVPADDRGLVLAGRYKLVEQIGEGGMGSVWMAQQVEPVRRVVAVKLIKPGMDSKAVLARFEAERQALALMEHPNIARVLDAGLSADGRPFFVMELVKGVPITQFCDARKLTPRQRLELFVPVCQAIQHAHQKGVIHRDIKPSNVLVALYDDHPVPKVIDFGVAKAAGQPLTDRTLLTGFGAVVGTPEYMSPEQASLNQLDVDTRSDVYSLGVLLYELLTGSPPHPRKELERAGLLEVLRVIREVEPPRPSARLSTSETLASLAAVRGTDPARLTRLVRGELDWLVMKALEKERARRYETANAFAAEVQRYLAGEPVQAVPPSAGYRLRKFVRRHRASVLTAAAFALLLLVGAAVSAWQAIAATRARNDADQARDAEADARANTEMALTESREKTARMTYERAQAFCEEGKADLGLLWMARSLELTPPGATDLDRTIRTSINLWARQHTGVRPMPPGFNLRKAALNTFDVAVSPDGRSVLTFDVHGVPRLCDLSTGNLRFTLPFEDDAPPAPDKWDGKWCPAFSPDGRLVAATREDRRVRVWDAATGQLIGKPLIHDHLVRGIGFDPAGKRLATAAGKQVRFWSVERGQPEGGPLTAAEGVEEELGGVEFSGDSRLLIAWTHNRKIPDRVLLWELPSGKLRPPLSKLELFLPIHHACFSPDGRLLLVSGFQTQLDGTLLPMARFWDVASGQPVGARMTREHTDSWRSFGKPCFRPDGRVLVTGGYPVRLWQVPSGKPLGTSNQLELVAWRPAFSPDGRVLFDLSHELHREGILDMAPGLEASQQLAVPRSNIVGFDVSPDGRWALTTHEDPRDQGERLSHCAFRLYDLAAGKAVRAPIEVKVPMPVSLPRAFSPDGLYLATMAGKNALQVWETATGRERGPRLEMNSPGHAVAFSPDGRLLAAGDESGEVRLWNAATGQAVGPPIVHGGTVSRLRFSPDGQKLLIGGWRPDKGQARLWDVGTAQPLGPALDTFSEVFDAAFSPDGRTFVTGSLRLIRWDAATCQPLWKVPMFEPASRVAFSPDGRQVLATCVNKAEARLFDARTGTPTGPHLRHKRGDVRAAFSPDGRLVLTTSADLTARLWDPATGLPVGPVWVNLHNAPEGYFTSDGRGLVLYEDDVISRWEVPGPIEGTPERVRLAVEAATRFSLDSYGGTQPLFPTIQPDPSRGTGRAWGPDPYEPVRKQLEELGGPPGYFRR
jgi:serine/threonine protein kinase/WD40 repeat protein